MNDHASDTLKGFTYGKCKIVANESSGLDEIHVEVSPRKNSKPRCGQCGKPGSKYDTRKPRSFQFVPILGLQVLFLYSMRRVDCKHCGAVKTEQLSWASGKEQMTGAYKWFLATWARLPDLVGLPDSRAQLERPARQALPIQQPRPSADPLVRPRLRSRLVDPSAAPASRKSNDHI